MKYLLTWISLTLLLFVTAEPSANKLYTWTDEKGNMHITQDPPPKNAKTLKVMTYQPQTEAQIQKNEADQRREEMQYEAEQKKEQRQESKKTSVDTGRQADDDVYFGREDRMIGLGAETMEMRNRRLGIRPEFRFHPR